MASKKAKKRDLDAEIEKAEADVQDSIESMLSEIEPMLVAAKYVEEIKSNYEKEVTHLAELRKEQELVQHERREKRAKKELAN